MATGAARLFWTGGGSHVVREALRLADDGSLSARTARLEALCDMFDERAEAIPIARARPCSSSLVRRLLQAHREWVEEVEFELGA
jgi:hypothetical protein